MQTLSLGMSASKDAGVPLDNCFFNFKNKGISFRRGQLILVAAAPGGGKSALLSHIVVHTRPKIPTLYFSCEMDAQTVGIQTAMSLLNKERYEVEEMIREGDSEVLDVLQESTDHIWYHWDSQPSCFELADEVQAYGLATGAYPHLIIVDNLINVDSEGQADHRGKDATLHWLQKLAQITNAAVVVLHHVTKDYNDGLTPIPLSGLMDQVGKRPRLVLTLFQFSDTLLGVRVVKNSIGKSAADASYGCEIAWTPERSYMKG